MLARSPEPEAHDKVFDNNLDRIGICESWFVNEWGKPGYPEKNLSEQGREPTTNSTHIWSRVWELNPGHIVGRRAVSPLRHPCSCLKLFTCLVQTMGCPCFTTIPCKLKGNLRMTFGITIEVGKWGVCVTLNLGKQCLDFRIKVILLKLFYYQTFFET